MTDFLDEKRQEITARMKELKPLVDEHNRLESALSALSNVGASSTPAAAAPRRRGRPPGSGRKKATPTAAPTPASASASASKAPAEPKAPAAPKATKAAKKPVKKAGRRAGRRKGSGQRAAEAEALVTEQPGITIPELAAKMGIKQNYLYRVLPNLKKEKKVQAKGRGWFPHPKTAT